VSEIRRVDTTTLKYRWPLLVEWEKRSRLASCLAE
jgi:hypothetical protein